MALPSAKELAGAIEKVGEHSQLDALAEIAARVVLDEAGWPCARDDGEAGLADRLSEELGLDAGEREIAEVDPLTLLEKGPRDASEAALLGALVAKGIEKQILERDEADRRELIAGLLEKLDWLEATTALSPYRAIGQTLGEGVAEVFWLTAATELSEWSAALLPDDPTKSARRLTGLMARASALDHAPEGLKAKLASALLPGAESVPIRRVALSALAGIDDPKDMSPKAAGTGRTARAATAARAPKLTGTLERKPWGWIARLLAAVTGILLLFWLVKLGSKYLLGYRREGAMGLTAKGVTVYRKVHLLGRVIVEASDVYPLRSLQRSGIELRFRYLHLLLGSLGLVIGAAMGVNFLVEGTCSGYSPLALFGVLIIGGGIIFDVLLEVLIPNREGVSTVFLDFGRRRFVRLRWVPQGQAQDFIKELEQLFPEPRRRSTK